MDYHPSMSNTLFTRFDYVSGTTTYGPVGFEYSDPSQIKVVLADDMGRTQTLRYNVDYTVASGKVTISSGAPIAIEPVKILAMRDTLVSDSPEFQHGIYLDVKKVQTSLATMKGQIEELRLNSDNSVKVAVQEWHEEGKDNPLAIPPLEQRKGRIMAFDEAGNFSMPLVNDVRQNLQQALEAEANSIQIAGQVEAARDEAVQAKVDAIAAKVATEGKISEAEAYAVQAGTYATDANTARQGAETAQAEAVSSAESVKTYNDIARQWAEGPEPSGSQPSQVNNAKYYAGQVGTAAAQAVASAGNASASAGEAYDALTSVLASKTDIENKISSAVSDFDTITTAKVTAIDTAVSEASEAISSAVNAGLSSISGTTSSVVEQVTAEGNSQKAGLKSAGDAEVARVQEVYQTDLSFKADKADVEAIASDCERNADEIAELKRVNREQSLRIVEQDNRIENLEAQRKGTDFLEKTLTTSNGVGTLNESPNTVLPNAFISDLRGKNIVWNQIAKYVSRASYYKNGITFTYNNGKLHANGTCTVTDWSYDGIQAFVDRSLLVNGHVVMLYGGTSRVGIGIREIGTSQKLKGEWWLTKLANSTTSQFVTFYESGVDYDDDIPLMVVDLTTLFGVTETTQVTDSMKTFVRQYAEAHPQYDAGSLQSSRIVNVASIGKEKSMLSDIQYKWLKENVSLWHNDHYIVYLDTKYGNVCVLNMNDTYTSANNFFKGYRISDSASAYIQTGQSYADTLLFDRMVYIFCPSTAFGSFTGYSIVDAGKTVGLPHPSRIVDFPNIELKEGDVYYPSTGMLTETYAVVDLSTLSWGYQNNQYGRYWYSNEDPSIAMAQSASSVPQLICDTIQVASPSTTTSPSGNANCQYISIDDSKHRIIVSYASGGASPTGTLVYKLTSPAEPHKVAEPISPWLEVENGSTISVESTGAQAECTVHYIADLRT